MVRMFAAGMGLVIAAALSACAGSADTPGRTVTLTVRVFQVGGATAPAGQKPPPPAPLAGWKVTVAGTSGSNVAVETSSPSGRAKFNLQPGSYAVTASMTHVCGGVHHVSLSTGVSATLDINCPAA